MSRVPGRMRGGLAIGVAAVAALPLSLEAQAAHSHAPADDPAAHSHSSAPVSCTTLASPPWSGLSEGDRQRFSMLQSSVAQLATPEAARRAGFQPVLGNIPGMGVHYVSGARSRDGVNVEEPDHLLFAPVDGEERLVGAAYAFTDVVATDVEIPFESDLAGWHDHPELASGNQTLHMLHVWFVPSSHGPFAGLNFWLPFQGAGIQPPNACWLADEADAERIQQVSFALAVTNAAVNDPAIGAIVRELSARRAGQAAQLEERQSARAGVLAELDAAARADDHHAWTAAADRYLATLTPLERTAVDRVLQRLTHAQMSTPERDAARQ